MLFLKSNPKFQVIKIRIIAGFHNLSCDAFCKEMASIAAKHGHLNLVSPASQKSSSNSRISIYVILSQLLQMVQGYNAERITPEFLSIDLLNTTIEELKILRDRMGNSSNNQEVA